MPSNLLNADVAFPNLREDQTNDEKIAQVVDYLYMLLEQLRYSFGNMSPDNFSDGGMRELQREINEPVLLRVESAEGDLLKLDLTAQQITSRMEDAEGNISTLTQTAEGLTAAIYDADGQLETRLAATAQTLTAQITNVEEGLSAEITATAAGLSADISTVGGRVTTLSASVDGISARILSAEGNITTINADVSGLKTTVTDHTGSISTLQQAATGLDARVTDAEGNISALQAFPGSIQLSVTNGQKSSTITLTGTGITAEAQTIEFTGQVVFASDLGASGTTVIDGGRISSGTITGITITGNTISGNTISGGTISGTTMSASTISGNTISGGTISGTTITGTTISGGTIDGATFKAKLNEGDPEGTGQYQFYFHSANRDYTVGVIKMYTETPPGGTSKTGIMFETKKVASGLIPFVMKLHSESDASFEADDDMYLRATAMSIAATNVYIGGNMYYNNRLLWFDSNGYLRTDV